jgi:hypothetical protein
MFKKFNVGKRYRQSGSDCEPRTLRASETMENDMTLFKTLIAAALISVSTIPSAFAWSFMQQEPSAFAAMYPNRDVLNGGALTPAGRMGLERAGGAAPVFTGREAPAFPGRNVYLGTQHR